MDRKSEFNELKRKLSTNSSELLDNIEIKLNKRVKKSKIRIALLTPIVTIGIFMCIFVSLINISPKFAYACSKIPILSELTKSTLVSESIKSMIKNTYSTELGITKSSDGIKVTIDQYAICNNDIYIVVSVETKNDIDLVCLSKVKLLNGDIISEGPIYLPIENNKGYFKISLEDHFNIYSKDNIVDGKTVKLDFNFEFKNVDNEEEYYSKGIYESINEGFKGTCNINIPLDIDITNNIVEKETIDFSQSIEIDNQILNFTNAYLTPAYISIDVIEAETNTKSLNQIVFYIKNGVGKEYKIRPYETFLKKSYENPLKQTYFLETPYFGNNEKLDIYITKVGLLNKDYQMAYINLDNIESSNLPIGTELLSAERVDDKIKLSLKFKNQSLILNKCFDESNNEYKVKTLSRDGNNLTVSTYELEISDFLGEILYFDLFNDKVIEYNEPLQINIR